MELPRYFPQLLSARHVILRKEMPDKTIVTVVPLHDEVDRGTLLEIIRQAGMSKDDFLNLS